MKRPLKKLLKDHLLEEHDVKDSKKFNEYPKIFAKVSAHYHKMQEVNILSYGCQTGEECFSQKEYFDNYKIVGMESNKMALKAARAVNSDPNIIFVRTGAQSVKEYGPYDIIYCMTILCSRKAKEDTQDISEIYSFEAFEDELKLLDAQLKENGLLVIYNANFEFKLSSLYQNYEVIEIPKDSNGKLPKFGKDNMRTTDVTNEMIFRKKYNDVSIQEHEGNIYE